MVGPSTALNPETAKNMLKPSRVRLYVDGDHHSLFSVASGSFVEWNTEQLLRDSANVTGCERRNQQPAEAGQCRKVEWTKCPHT